MSRIDEVTVTGSLIKRSEDSSQFVTSIDITEVCRQGSTNALEILRQIPANQMSDVSNVAGRGSGLTNLANLSSLGAENTLDSGSGPVVEYKHQLFLGWQSNNWALPLQNSFQSEYDDC